MEISELQDLLAKFPADHEVRFFTNEGGVEKEFELFSMEEPVLCAELIINVIPVENEED